MKLRNSMKSNNSPRTDLSPRGAMFPIRNVAMVIALGICGAVGSTAVQAQATSGTLFGWAPAGETITIEGSNGTHHHTTVNAKGRYSLSSLPNGTYTVTLEKDGQAIEKHLNVNIVVGRGQEVDFICRGAKCSGATSN
jgi:hypothetical protein